MANPTYILHDTPTPVHVTEVGTSVYILAGTVQPKETVVTVTVKRKYPNQPLPW